VRRDHHGVVERHLGLVLVHVGRLPRVVVVDLCVCPCVNELNK
jgi:hypothetical protein